MEPKSRNQPPALTVSLSPALSGNVALLSAITKQTARQIVEEAVAEYLLRKNLNPGRMPKLQFP
ncbi:MAG: hypothetical protein ACM3NH_00660 [Candidatus Saccharibacteria bacterium]